MTRDLTLRMESDATRQQKQVTQGRSIICRLQHVDDSHAGSQMSNFDHHHPGPPPVCSTRLATISQTLPTRLPMRAWLTFVQDPSEASPSVRQEQWTRSVSPSGLGASPDCFLQPTLFKLAFELGAVSTSDFTDRVTHLIADSHGGAKYLVRLLDPQVFVAAHLRSVPSSARYPS